MELIKAIATCIAIAPVALTIVIIFICKRVDRQEKEIAALKASMDTMLKMGYPPPEKPKTPKYAAGGPMDSIRTGQEIF